MISPGVEKVRPWSVAAMIVVACLLVITAMIIPWKRHDCPRWRDPARELPEDGAQVVGVYVYEDAIERHTVVFQLYQSMTMREEYWIEPVNGGAGPCFGRPYRWAPVDEAGKLADPEIPDLLRKAISRRGTQ